MEGLYGTLEIRSINEDLREFEGIANTASVDTHGTIVVPEGGRVALPIPLYWEHGHLRREPAVGEVIAAELRGGAWHIRARLPQIAEPGLMRDAVDRAWHSVKYGLARGLSIGAIPVPGATRGKKIMQWVWRELSITGLPSNTDATIYAVRSAFGAATGATSPGDSGTLHSSPTPRLNPMTLQEQATALENRRAALEAERTGLMTRSAEAGRTLEADETEAYDAATEEIAAIDAHLSRLNMQIRSAPAPVPVVGTSVATAVDSRSPSPAPRVVVVRSADDAGLGFSRYVMALAACNGNKFEAAEYARQAWDGDQGEGVAMMHRAAVAAGTTTNGTFAAPLVQTNYLTEFLELLRPATLIGRIPNFQRVPFNVSMTTQTAGGTYNWVGQGVGKPVTNLQVAAVTLGMAKAAGIIVISDELARSSAPSAQEVVRRELINGMQAYLDAQLVDPAVAAVANVSPASLTNGVTGTAASGTTEAAARLDIGNLLATFATNLLGMSGVVILMGETIALRLSLLQNAVGNRTFPDLSLTGGSIFGLPVVTSNVSALSNRIVAIHAPSVMFADDGGTQIDISREATIIMDSSPATVVQAAGAAPIHTSLWQNNLIGLRAERWINWGKARSTAVQMITGVAYA